MTNNYWNYRVIRTIEAGEQYFTIHEVHYEDDTPVMLGREANIADYDLNALSIIIDLISEAVKKPVIDYTALVKTEDDYIKSLMKRMRYNG